jgi:two-component system, NtrC family, sensor kinase
LRDAFEGGGFEVVLCATAAEARSAIRETFDIVILDVVLPDADGVELLVELRRDAPATPMILLSSEAEVRDRIRGLNTGADEYVGKPYDTTYLVGRARELIHEREPALVPDGRTTVLVIDDSLTFRAALTTALEDAGYRAVGAATGEEGLRIAAVSRPGAVLVDGILPGIDGVTVVRRMRLDAVLRGTPCLLLTASADRSAELLALDAGVDAFVRKDQDLTVILARLAAILRSAGSAPVADMSKSVLGPKKILAVDDSPTYLHTLADALRGDGYDVVLASSGEEAIALLAVQRVDCILLDLIMPGMGGEETCRRVKAAPAIRETPLIMLTAQEDRAAMLSGLGAGADDFIAKSNELAVIKARVVAQIRRKHFEDENRRIREQLLHQEREASEARASRALAEVRAVLLENLEAKNRELQTFSYSVSHDLRSPLRAIDGFSRILAEDHASRLDPAGRALVDRIRGAAQRMGDLIEAMLDLSRVSSAELKKEALDLGLMAVALDAQLRMGHPGRNVKLICPEHINAVGDPHLLNAVLENLLGNAWKFTAGRELGVIEIGVESARRPPVYFVRDNGAGFDMALADRLFAPFQRLHASTQFAGTGIGLATVRRIVERHGGRIWAEASVDRGATFRFTLTAPTEIEVQPGDKPALGGVT